MYCSRQYVRNTMSQVIDCWKYVLQSWVSEFSKGSLNWKTFFIQGRYLFIIWNPLAPSMSFYPDFISILSWFYPDFIQILSR